MKRFASGGNLFFSLFDWRDQPEYSEAEESAEVEGFEVDSVKRRFRLRRRMMVVSFRKLRDENQKLCFGLPDNQEIPKARDHLNSRCTDLERRMAGGQVASEGHYVDTLGVDWCLDIEEVVSEGDYFGTLGMDCYLDIDVDTRDRLGGGLLVEIVGQVHLMGRQQTENTGRINLVESYRFGLPPIDPSS
jgi:hypothetical protein